MEFNVQVTDVKPGSCINYAGWHLEIISVEIYDDLDTVEVVCKDHDDPENETVILTVQKDKKFTQIETQHNH